MVVMLCSDYKKIEAKNERNKTCALPQARKMKNWKALDIIWDIDLEEDETYEEAMETLGLPVEMEIPSIYIDDMAEDDDVYDKIADYLSDKTGFCVNSFELVQTISDFGETDQTQENTAK